MMKKQKIAVLGPGSWGTALAQVLNDNGHEVRIWGNIPEQIDEINEKHTNTRYFKDVVLDENIKAYKELSQALDGVNAILFVVPTKVTRLVAKQVAELLDHEVVIMFSNNYFRLYTNSDVIGVETAGALKNIIAVGAGALHGMGYGDNAKAAVITRGLAEITRLGVKLGADPLTYSGLSGVGDLIVTGTSIHSRNWRAGDALGRGEKLEDIERNMGMVIEGISTTKVAYEIAQELNVYMPITTAIYKSIYEGADIKESILNMMSNELRSENEWDKK